MSALQLTLEPRQWQHEALSAWDDAGRRGTVEVVTGGGKTVFAELCMHAVTREDPDVKCVVIVPSHALLDQWIVGLQEDFQLDDRAVVGWSGHGVPATPALINVMVLNTARWAAPRLARDEKTMLVVDECHRAASPANIQALRGDHVATLGMSATPERDYDDAFAESVAPLLGEIIYRYGLNEARRDSVVSPFELVNVEVDLLPDEESRYHTLTRRIMALQRKAKGDRAAAERLTVLLRQRARVSALASMRIPVACHLTDRHRGVRAIVFHEDIGAAETIRDNLRQRGHSVTIYHSRIADPVRRDNLRLFRRGVFDVLVTCRALDEGVNVPSIELAIIASATASTRQRIQRLGRALRPAPGKDRATIYTLYATQAEENRLLEEATTLTEADTIRWQKSRISRGSTAG